MTKATLCIPNNQLIRAASSECWHFVSHTTIHHTKQARATTDLASSSDDRHIHVVALLGKIS